MGDDDAPLYRSGKGFSGVSLQLGSTLDSIEGPAATQLRGNYHGGDAIALLMQLAILTRQAECSHAAGCRH
jgi:hypothetical protein